MYASTVTLFVRITVHIDMYIVIYICMYMQVFTIPPGCVNTSCNYMARWFRDGEYLLFELSANTNGWVAIGLSGDAMMSSAAFDDVIACQAEEGGATVNAKDMHNPTGQRRNALDAVSRVGSHVL